MTTPRRLLVIADVGGATTRHIGDEAMFEANVDGLRRAIPNVGISVISRDPDWIEQHYGLEAVPVFGFPGALNAHVERAEMLRELLSGLDRVDGNNATIAALHRADAVVISGGGNLASSWPDLACERVALLRLADLLGKPTIVLGQTLGPRLGSELHAMLSEALPLARFVGVREIPSAAFAIAIGVRPERVWYQGDDALFFCQPAEVGSTHGDGGAPPSIVVTIDPQFRASSRERFDSLARQLRELAQSTAATLLLVPHEFGGESRGLPSDLTEARLLAEAIALPGTRIAANIDAATAARLAHSAEIVVSSRYHPLVFAMAAGRPSIGIYGDEYSRIKLQGALAHAGCERWALSYDDVARGELISLALEQWKARDEIRSLLEDKHDAWRDESQRRWAAAVRALDSAMPETPAAETMFGRSTASIVSALIASMELGRSATERLAARCDEVERTAIAFETMARPYLTLRRHASRLLSFLRKLGSGRPDGLDAQGAKRDETERRKRDQRPSTP